MVESEEESEAEMLFSPLADPEYNNPFFLLALKPFRCIPLAASQITLQQY